MKLIRNAAISAAFLLVFVIGAVAQQQQQQGAKETGEGKVPIAGKATLGVTVEETQLLAPGWRASKLMRSDVRNDKDEKIGKIDDLIISPDGTLSIAVIDVGGFIGVDRHRVAIPVRQFKKLEAENAVLPGATKEELKKLPEFEYTK